jgi:hypothetical protein
MEPLFKIHMAIVQIMKTIMGKGHNALYGNYGSASALAKYTYYIKGFNKSGFT